MIAYQRSDNKNIMLLDPASGSERELVHSPSYSPDGRRIAVFWYRGERGSGVYIFDPVTSTNVKAGEGLYPRGWSRDGRYIYFQWPQSPIVYQIEAGQSDKPNNVVLKPGFREAQCFPVGATSPNSFICAAFDFTSDIWRIDNF